MAEPRERNANQPTNCRTNKEYRVATARTPMPALPLDTLQSPSQALWSLQRRVAFSFPLFNSRGPACHDPLAGGKTETPGVAQSDLRALNPPNFERNEKADEPNTRDMFPVGNLKADRFSAGTSSHKKECEVGIKMSNRRTAIRKNSGSNRDQLPLPLTRSGAC